MSNEAGDLLQQVCIKAVRAGSRVAQAAQRDWLGRSVQKEDKSPVTVADFAVQAVVSYHLFAAFPKANLVAEETADTFLSLPELERKECLRRVQHEVPEITTEEEICGLIGRGNYSNLTAESTFILDPIDGTKGFIRGEQYAVCLGLLSAQGEPTVGVIGCPNLWGSNDTKGFLFEAQVGTGGTRIRKLFPEDGDDVVLQTVSSPTTATKVVFAESFEKSHTVPQLHQRLLDKFNITEEAVIRIDSQTKYGLLVRGDATVYPRITSYDQCIWDVLPGAVILQQAGGKITDHKGDQLDYKSGGRYIRNHTLLSSCSASAELHETLVSVILQ